MAEDLVEQRRVQEFYYRISTIAREYIERRFAIMAPEMTTEEFLYSLERDRRLEGQAGLLSEFLRSCDLVKYARLLPTGEDIDQVVRSVRRLVDETARAEALSFEDSLLEEEAA